jgi:acetyl esterase/lipase
VTAKRGRRAIRRSPPPAASPGSQPERRIGARPAPLALLRLLLLALLPGLGGCAQIAYTVAIPFLYEEAELPEAQVLRDVAYRDDPSADPVKHRLDLFLPAPGGQTPAAQGGGWPLLVFVHGGGWTSGDKGLRVGGADVYGNIGRFFAARGVATAVISYRLQPEATWQQQVDDVERATELLRRRAAGWGANPRALFLAGHSAGAQLATWAALAPDAGPVCGLIPISGAGFDLADAETYQLGASRDYYEERFANGGRDAAWAEAASVVRLARPELPPALILFAEDDYASLKRQAQVLDEALRAQGVESRVVVVPDESHSSIVLTLSRDDRTAAPAMLEFIRAHARPPRC